MNDSEHEPGVVKARIFQPQNKPELHPYLKIDTENFPYISTDLLDDPWQFPQKSINEINVVRGSAIFVPSGNMISFKKETSTNLHKKNITLFRFCYLDASNLNAFKSHLSLVSYLNKESMKLLKSISSPNFNLSMVRDLQSLPNDWKPLTHSSPHQIGQSKSRYLGSKNRRGRVIFSQWQITKSWEHLVMQFTLPILPRPDIVMFGRRSVTLTWLISFSMKRDDSSSVGYIVSWDTIRNSSIFETSNFTFEHESSKERVTIENETKMVGQSRKTFSQLTMGRKTSCSFDTDFNNITVTIRDLEPETRYSFRVALYYGDGRKGILSLGVFSAPSYVQTDQPGTPFPITSVPSQLPPIKWNSVLLNKERSGNVLPFFPSYGSDATFIIVEVFAPDDDGGSDILGYDIMRTQLDSLGRPVGQWSIITHGIELLKDYSSMIPGGLIRIGIHNLLPGISYKFKVAARNQLGRGLWSPSSEVISTYFYSTCSEHEVRRNLKSINENHGFVPKLGHQLYGRGTRYLFTPSGHEQIGTEITLDVVRQVLISKTYRDQTVDIWSCFWSPLGYLVTAETCEMKWNKDEVINTDDLSDRIAYTERRPEIPMVDLTLAAQRAGALGLIIIDNGQCAQYDQYCMQGASKQFGDYWGELDSPLAWKNVNIPVVFSLETTHFGMTRDWLRGL